MKYLSTIILTVLLNNYVMGFELKTEITINATPNKVWKILTEFNKYESWNPFIKTLNGDVNVGEKIAVTMKPPNGKAMTFKPKVLTLTPNKEFSWLGHFLIPGIFDGHHKFTLIDNNNGTTTFIQSEEFHGILIPLLKKKLNGDIRNSFIKMNEQLKRISEL